MDDNPVRRAVDAIGGILQTQIAIEVNYWTLRDWMKSKVVPSTKYAVLLSEACGGVVTVRELAGLDRPATTAPQGKRRRRPSSATYPDSGPPDSATSGPLTPGPSAHAA